jgi:WD40 repeat protein
VSSDQTLRIWDLKGSNFSNPTIIYDHEEEIVASASNGHLLASMDTDGTIFVRDMKGGNVADVVQNLKVYKEYETAFILYNSKVHNELFVFFNNELAVYDADGSVIQRMEFDHNIVFAVQDEDTLIVAYEEGGIACYDWNKDKIVDEYTHGVGPIKSITVSDHRVPKQERILVCGGKSGEVYIFRHKSS